MLVSQQRNMDKMKILHLYNTRTRSKEQFKPIDPLNVRMYVCGPTVYDRAHIGNGRPVVVFDVLFRLLKFLFGERAVTYVRNITDVDDKIITRASQENRSMEELTSETIEWFHSDNRFLNTCSPTHEPRATDFISEMISMIQKLINFGNAYVSTDGQVFFSVKSHTPYGELSNQSIKDMIAGSRIEVDLNKNNPLDFVLWKPVIKPAVGWESPWGFGRPGWHIECSAMTNAILGETFDIHGGGIDLVFPHHENEAAQSICANKTKTLANVWLHNGFVNIEGEKMSKSLGNFLTIDDLKKQKLSGDIVRLILLSTHYRQPLDWTNRKISEASNIIGKWKTLVREKPSAINNNKPANEVIRALCDDLNTPLAITKLHELLKNREYEKFLSSANLLGLLLPEEKTHGTNDEVAVQRSDMELIEKLLQERKSARDRKDYEMSDSIRFNLEKAGVVIKDSPDGTTWTIQPRFKPDFLRKR
jgi:cysteinyl-tRNA synthetase